MSEALTDRDLETRRAIEAVVLAATEPVPPQVLAQLVELPTTRVEELCDALAAEYERDGRGFVLARVAGGYRFQTHPEAAPYVERFVLDGRHVRLSGPALETLAIIAYKQPISRAQLSAIRGVDVDTTLRTLVARGYVEETGHEHSPGRPSLFGTTGLFLEKIGIDSIDDLPPLADFVPGAHVVEALERGLHLPGDAAAEEAEDEPSPLSAAGGDEEEEEEEARPSDLAAELLAGLDGIDLRDDQGGPHEEPAGDDPQFGR